MKCPYFMDSQSSEVPGQCFGIVVPFEPSTIDRVVFCTTSRHRHCPLFRNATSNLTLEIHREVARAVD